jgi:hypothetical protein
MRHATLLFSLALSLMLSTASNAKVAGQVTGFGPLANDDVIDGALAVPSLRPTDLLSFQLDHFVAPSEEMEVGPVKTKVPGNLFFPRQRESYGILPLTIERNPFSYIPVEGQKDELSAFWFSAPFNKVADLARAKAPYWQILPLVRIRALGVTSDTDWSTQNRALISLDRPLVKDQRFVWTRPPAGPKDADIAVNFQISPEGRWILADFMAGFGREAMVASSPRLPPDQKLVLVRVRNSEQNKPVSAQAYIVSMKPKDRVERNGLPELLKGVEIRGSEILWTAPGRSGAISVLKGADKKAKSFEANVFEIFGDFGLSDLFFMSTEQVFWADPAAGRLDIGPTDKASSIAIVFVGTSEPVKLGTDEVFTKATDLTMLRVK